MNVHTRWADPAQDKACITWARDLFNRTAPFAAGSVYVNFMPSDDEGRMPEAYGSNFDRLRKIKAKYDPQNLFRLNHNIQG
jgi:FAD/FMN-containing dehydrogenase